MSTAIFAVGVGLFALTTWASLVIGYLRFQHIEEPESADETVDPLDQAEIAEARARVAHHDDPQLRAVGDAGDTIRTGDPSGQSGFRRLAPPAVPPPS